MRHRQGRAGTGGVDGPLARTTRLWPRPRPDPPYDSAGGFRDRRAHLARRCHRQRVRPRPGAVAAGGGRGLRRGAGRGMADRQRGQRRPADGAGRARAVPASWPGPARTPTRSRSAPTTCPRRLRGRRRCAPRCCAAVARVSTGQVSLTQPGADGVDVERIRVLATFGDLDSVAHEVRTSAVPPDLPPPEPCVLRPRRPRASCATPRCSTAWTCGWTRPRPAGPPASRPALGPIRGWLRLRRRPRARPADAAAARSTPCRRWPSTSASSAGRRRWSSPATSGVGPRRAGCGSALTTRRTARPGS